MRCAEYARVQQFDGLERLHGFAEIAERGAVVPTESKDTLRMRWAYAKSLFKDPAATLDDLREVVTTLEDTSRIARRVLGSAHPFTKSIETALQDARAELRACETPSI